MTTIRALLLPVCLSLAVPAAAPAAARTLKASPSRATRGQLVTFTGAHWPARRTVLLLIGPANSEAQRFTSTRTTASGRIRKRFRLPATATPGRYVVLACRQSCRMKATTRLTILAPRSATTSEARAISAAALGSLGDTGWTVSHIRVSNVTGTYRYAAAEVEQRSSGVGGSMLLRGRAGSWSVRFLGTNDFCTASGVPRRAIYDLGFGPC